MALEDAAQVVVSGEEDSGTQQTPSWTSLLSSKLKAIGSASASISLGTVEETRDALSKDLTTLESATREVKAHINALSPTRRLPPEVIAHVFSLLSDEFPPGNIPFIPGRKPLVWTSLGWIVVSHVCRHWRQVALENPSLWSKDIFSNPQWTAERFSRSKNAPILLRLRVSAHSDSDLIQKVINSTHRMQEVIIESPYLMLSRLVKAFLAGPAPLLTNLELVATDIERPVPGIAILPSKFFDGYAPRLTRLVLSDCTCPWEPRLFKNIVHIDLRITGSTGRDSSLPSFDSLFSALECMTQLQHLGLMNVLHTGLTTVPDRSVALPSSFQSLSLSGNAGLNASLMEHLEIPPSSRISIRTVCPETDSEMCSRILPFVHPHSGGAAEPLRTVSIIGSYTRRLVLKAWRKPLSINEFNSPKPYHEIDPGDPSVEIVFGWKAPRTSSEVLYDVLANLHLADVTVLYVDAGVPSYIADTIWTRSFARFAAVERVCIGGDTWGFVEALARDTRSDDERSLEPASRSLIFPGLCHLKLEAVDLNQAIPGDRLFVAGLVDTLLDRLSQNNVLDVLEIFDCDITPDLLVSLREIVPTVIWDGWEGSSAPGAFEDDVVFDIGMDEEEDWQGDDIDEEANIQDFFAFF